MAEVLRFGEVSEAAERLSEEEQETLLDVLQKRLTERRRDEIGEEVREARLGHDRGVAHASTPDELMRETLS
jgi:hypothetical protein